MFFCERDSGEKIRRGWIFFGGVGGGGVQNTWKTKECEEGDDGTKSGSKILIGIYEELRRSAEVNKCSRTV